MTDEEPLELFEILAEHRGNPESAAAWLINISGDAIEESRHREALEQARVLDLWGVPLNGLDLLIGAVDDVREAFDQRHFAAAHADQVRRVQVLREMAQDAILVAKEVAILLTRGYPAGALTRWRTLHEIQAAAYAVGAGTDELALRYLEHESLRSARINLQVHVVAKRHDLQRVERSLLNDANDLVRDLSERYEPEFSGDLGWAHPLLLEHEPRYRDAHHNGQRARGPLISDLRRFAGLTILDADYTLASFAVHASTRVRHHYSRMHDTVAVLGPISAGLDIAGVDTAQAVWGPLQELLACYPIPGDQELMGGLALIHAISERVVDEFRRAAAEQRLG